MLELTKIEKELVKLSKNEKKRWQAIAMLLIKVRDEKLYESKSEESFSAWLNKLAENANLHPTGFWRFLAAGTYYLEKTGRDVDDLESVGVSAVKLELVKRIAEIEPSLEDDLFEKTITDNITVKELKDQLEILKDGLTMLDKRRADMLPVVNMFKDTLQNMTEYERAHVVGLLIASVHRTGNRQILEDVLVEINIPLSAESMGASAAEFSTSN